MSSSIEDILVSKVEKNKFLYTFTCIFFFFLFGFFLILVINALSFKTLQKALTLEKH